MKIAPFLIAVFLAQALFANPKAESKWIATWVSAQQPVDAQNQPPAPGLRGNTLRQIVQPSLSGSALRITFSNAYGDGPLTIGAATVARSQGATVIESNSVCDLTFGGQHSITLQPGASLTSDPVSIAVRAFENLAISTYCTAVSSLVTGHPGSRTTSFVEPGNQVSVGKFKAPKVTDHWYFLAELDVLADASASAVLVLGDSITDGRGSITNENNRWPDNLARRLRANPGTANVAVLNQGIGGNRVLRNGLGPSALQRFESDVLIPPGVRWVIIFEGINDVGTAVSARAKGEPAATAQDIIAGYAQMIAKARARGLKVYGATLMPFQGFDMYYNARSDADRIAVNQWIRTPGNFDGVIDFDEIARDPKNPVRLSARIDGGDHLHPSASGYKVMADAIDLSLFTEK